MKKLEILHLVLSVSLILSIGLLTGYSLGYFHAKKASFPQIKMVEDTNPGITTINFLKFQSGKIMAQVKGNPARIAYSPENILDVQPGQEFEIPVYQINLDSFFDAADLPNGTKYIASSQGKYYYSVLDPQAFKITPKNRVYFTNESQAIGSGYHPKN